MCSLFSLSAFKSLLRRPISITTTANLSSCFAIESLPFVVSSTQYHFDQFVVNLIFVKRHLEHS